MPFFLKERYLFCIHMQVTGTITTLYKIVFSALLFFTVHSAVAQEDSTDTVASDSFFLLRYKGLLGRLAKSITTDTTTDGNLVRIDRLYRRYTGRVIRRITIRSVDFGVPINDTTKSFKNTLTNWASTVHRTTRERVIRNNLFFRENERLLPILLADNERHLRDQAYLNDVKIEVRAVLGTRDSVDVLVLTKDVLSLGGSFHMSRVNKVLATVREDNFGGRGDRLLVGGFFDAERTKRFGFGGEYVLRNVGGSFMDASFGFVEYEPTFNLGHRQDQMIYVRAIKPLVNPYMKWTYALELSNHRNFNYYLPDTTYQQENRYRYYNIDAWIGFNRNARNLNQVRDDRLRTLFGLRFLHTEFQLIPQKYEEEYFYQYANLTGVLGSMSLFRQDFYKTQYVYGFGRSEDVPEGIDFSITTGWTNKNRRVRPYMGLDLQYNYFSEKKHYFNYTFRVGGYSYKNRYEDVSILANLEFFSRLKQLNSKWKQRIFVTAGAATQIRKQLNEPLLLESAFGLPEYQNIFLGSDHRITVKAESVFFSNWSLAMFRFAPFVFANAAVLLPEPQPLNKFLFGTVGGGIRSRNEGLVFGTLELRVFYFPGKNFNGDLFRVDFNTNIKFKYNNQFIRRPQFIVVN